MDRLYSRPVNGSNLYSRPNSADKLLSLAANVYLRGDDFAKCVGQTMVSQAVRFSAESQNNNNNCKSKITREAVLAELALMAEGHHPECQKITGRFVRCPQFQQACNILADAIQMESYRYPARRDQIPAPPGWLLPV